MFGLVQYHVVTDTISHGSISGTVAKVLEGVGRSGAFIAWDQLQFLPNPHGTCLPNTLTAQLTDSRGNGAPTYTGNPELWSVSFFPFFFFFFYYH